MIESEGILRLVTQRNKLVFGCLLCKKNQPHQHEEPEKPQRKELPFSKTRTHLLMKDIKEIFFKNYRGRWYTVRPINEKETT